MELSDINFLKDGKCIYVDTCRMRESVNDEYHKEVCEKDPANCLYLHFIYASWKWVAEVGELSDKIKELRGELYKTKEELLKAKELQNKTNSTIVST